MNQHIFCFCIAFCFSSQSGKKMSEQAIVAFNGVGFSLGLNQHFFRDKFIVSLPVVSTHNPFRQIFNLLPQLYSCFCSSRTNFTIDEPVPISINSNPDPAIVFFEPIYVCISSSSITSISSGFLNSSSFSPKDLIQLKTATWLTFKYLPIERNPNPSRYKISASLLNSLGLPTCSTVKRCLQSLQKYLCRFLTIPSLRKLRLLHFGQFFMLIKNKLTTVQIYTNYTKLTIPKNFYNYSVQLLSRLIHRRQPKNSPFFNVYHSV